MKKRSLAVGLATLIALAMMVGTGPTPSQAAYFDWEQFDWIYSTSAGFHQLGVFDYYYWSWIDYAEAWGTSFGDNWGVWWEEMDCWTWFQSQLVVNGVINDALFRYEWCP